MGVLESIAYEAAVRALDKQERVLEELRARTGILLAASSIATSLFGGRALADPHPLGLILTAVIAFGVSLGYSVYILLPRSGFVFALSGREIYEGLYEFRGDEAEIRRRLAYDLQRFWDKNETRMHGVRRAFRIAAAGLAIEVPALLLSVSDIL